MYKARMGGFMRCGVCGAVLETGETCNCDRYAIPIPKDGLRARCPGFGHRASYRGVYYIRCAKGKLRFLDARERDEFYIRFCCKEGCCDI